MKIRKYGHCCMLIEEEDVRFLTDPGVYSSGQNDARDIHSILITHEHQDHCHIDSVRTILEKNPDAQIFTNRGVGKLLEIDRIPYTLLENGISVSVRGVSVDGFGKDHAEILPTVPVVENTSYLVAGKLFYPGDAFYSPQKALDILALPIAGPWMKISEALAYAKTLTPRLCIPAHDGILTSTARARLHAMVKNALKPLGVQFLVPSPEKEIEI